MPLPPIDVATALHDAWARTERTLNGSLGAILGITYSEHRLLSALGNDVDAGASRVAISEAVGLTPSAVTRALQPLAKLGYVENVPHPRDARMTIAKLTPSGLELLANSTELLNDIASNMTENTPTVNSNHEQLLAMLGELANA